jgi:hypothetical protein
MVRGPAEGWILHSTPYATIAAGGPGGLVLTTDGYLYSCYESLNETQVDASPLTYLSSSYVGFMEDAAARVVSGTFGPTIEQKARSRAVKLSLVALALLAFCGIIVAFDRFFLIHP